MDMMNKPVPCVSTEIITDFGPFTLLVWQGQGGKEPVVLIAGEISHDDPPIVRVHSECLTGDVFDSLDCDCGKQKELALRIIQKSKNGVFIYDREEGRGIGLYEKVKALKLQKVNKLNTYDANVFLGHPEDARNYKIAATILDELGILKVRLLTNNPDKISRLVSLGIEVVERVPLVTERNEFNQEYLYEKEKIGNHKFDSN